MYYRRARVQGATYFFTVNLADRSSDALVRNIGALRESMASVKATHPFSLVAMVVLPDHLHTIWRLPENDANYSVRWSLLKAGFSRRIEKTESIAPSRALKRERGLWQRRFWEHQIKDEDDLARHIDYIHYNPVKHGWTDSPVKWAHSTLHGYIERGLLPENWGGCGGDESVERGER